MATRKKWLPFCRWQFDMHFIEWKLSCLDLYFIEVCSWGSNWQYVNIGSGNGLALNRWPAITWSSMDPDLKQPTASQGHDDISHELNTEFYCALFCCTLKQKMSTFWRKFNHWLCRKLSISKLPVETVTKISSKCQPFCFRIVVFLVLGLRLYNFTGSVAIIQDTLPVNKPWKIYWYKEIKPKHDKTQQSTNCTHA